MTVSSCQCGTNQTTLPNLGPVWILTESQIDAISVGMKSCHPPWPVAANRLKIPLQALTNASWLRNPIL